MCWNGYDGRKIGKKKYGTCPSETANAVDFNADQNRIGTFHAAIVSNNLQNVVVVLFIIKRLRIANHTCKAKKSSYKQRKQKNYI